jgi:diacylglycerol kinase (ATP)
VPAQRILLVTNPSSGGSDDEALAAVESELRAAGDVQRLEPGGVEPEAEIQSAARTADVVVVAGGDGTLHRIVNALRAQLEELVFGLIPMGTGNDFARTLRVPEEPGAAARIAAGDGVRRVDLGRARGGGVERLFVNACIGGFPVAMNEAVDQDTKARLGPLAFWLGGAKVVADLPRTTVILDGVQVTDCLAAGVGNGKTSGGGIALWPDASLDDGALDGCALGAPSLAVAGKVASRLKAGTHEGLDEVVTTRGRAVTIDSDPPIEINVDGELVGLRTPATFEVIGSLRIKAQG